MKMTAQEKVLAAIRELKQNGSGEVYGFQIAKHVGGRRVLGVKVYIGFGTLYTALRKLEESGILTSRWEDEETAAGRGGPRRRYYRLVREETSKGGSNVGMA